MIPSDLIAQKRAKRNQAITKINNSYNPVIDQIQTIADLRAYDTRNLDEGDKVIVKAHNANGLDKEFGGGTFVWKTTPLFTLLTEIGTTNSEDALVVNITPLTEGLSARWQFGEKIIFENGMTTNIAVTQSAVDSRPHPDEVSAYGVGETQILLRDRSAQNEVIPANLKAYRQDDDGVYIRPNFADFDGHGYWQRVMNDGTVTPQMYGAIPNNSPRDGAINDATSAIQKAFDSWFNVRIGGGSFYISSTLYLQITKDVIHEGANRAFHLTGRRKTFSYGKQQGVIYTDQDIRMIECQCRCKYVGMLDTTEAPAHDKEAFAVMMKFDHHIDINLYVRGSIDYIQGNENIDSGTKAFRIVSDETPTNNDEINSNGGYVTFSDVKVTAIGCQSVISHTPYVDGSADPSFGSSFSNTTNFYAVGDYCKRLYDFYARFSISKFEGILQERLEEAVDDGSGADRRAILMPASWTNQQTLDYAACKLERGEGSYLDVFLWDIYQRKPYDFGGTVSYNELINTGWKFGPNTQKQAIVYDSIGGNTFDSVAGTNRVHGQWYFDRIKLRDTDSRWNDGSEHHYGNLRRRIVNVPPSRVATLGDDPVVLIENLDIPPNYVADVVSIFLGNLSPSDGANYTANKELIIYAENFTGSPDTVFNPRGFWSQFTIPDSQVYLLKLPLYHTGNDTFDVDTYTANGALHSVRRMVGSDVKLQTKNGLGFNPTGGTKGFTLMIDYRIIPVLEWTPFLATD